MKVLAYVLSVIVGTALVIGGGILIAVQTPRGHPVEVLFAFVAITIFVYGPLLIGATRTYWDTDASEDGKRYFRRWLIGVAIADVLAAIAIIVWAVLIGVPAWIPVVIIVVGAALLPASFALGGWLRRRDRARMRDADSAAWTPVESREIARKVTIAGIVFVAAFVIGFVTLVVFDAEETAELWPLSLSLAFLASGVACLIAALPLNRRLRESAGSDLGRVRKISKVVLSRKDLPLDESEKVAAAKYAYVAVPALGFQIGYIVLLYLGLGTQQVARIIDRGDAFSIGLTVLLAGMLVFFVPYSVVRMGRARRYAREHAGLLTTDAAAEPLDEPQVDAAPSDPRA